MIQSTFFMSSPLAATSVQSRMPCFASQNCKNVIVLFACFCFPCTYRDSVLRLSQFVSTHNRLITNQTNVTLKCDLSDQNELHAGKLHSWKNSKRRSKVIFAHFQILTEMDTEQNI